MKTKLNISLLSAVKKFAYFVLIVSLVLSMMFIGANSTATSASAEQNSADNQTQTTEQATNNAANWPESYDNPLATEDSKSINDIIEEHPTIGLMQGTNNAAVAQQIFGDNAEYQYFVNLSDVILAVESGKCDYLCLSVETATAALADHPGFVHSKEAFKSSDIAFAFPKADFKQGLFDELNAWVAEQKENGYIAFLKEKWERKESISDIEKEHRTFDSSNPQLNIATCSQVPPHVTQINGELSGLEIELIEKFFVEHNYYPNYTDLTFDGVIMDLNSGKNDFAVSNTSLTEERKKTMNFCDPHNTETLSFASMSKSDSSSMSFGEQLENFVGNIQSSFHKTFIVESRWLFIVYGILVTIIITLFSVLLGGLLGILIAILRLKNIKWLNKFFNIYIAVFQGTPLLVLLLILYYLIFGSSNINAIIVAIIAFGLNNSAYVSEAVKSGLESVDVGQKEAALSLGYSPTKTFIYFVFPQAAKNFIPNMRGLAISLMKDTSIVGYIAITDLTKVGDLIRSRTFDAFFPLITVAVVYFILAYIIRKIFEFIDKKFLYSAD